MEEVQGVDCQSKNQAAYPYEECRSEALDSEAISPGEDEQSNKEDGHQGIIKVCQFKTRHHAVDDGTIGQIACLSDGRPGEVLVEETGIECIAE
jgi:hypothetical protein